MHEERTGLEKRLVVLRDLVERWESVRVIPCDWEALARKARGLRARWARAEGLREQAEGVRRFYLTFTGLEANIKEAGERLAELVAMRPATCPLCGGPMHKGEH